MKKLLALIAFVLAACSPAPAEEPQQAAAGGKQQAVFAGGCFWCMEHDMQAIPGVTEVMSGYTGGKERNPTYEQVSSERTGHYESVRVTFDPNVITYDQLLARYWKLVDPTDDEGQFCDRGPSYRPAIFVTPDQRTSAEASKKKIVASGKVNGTVIVPILPLGEFWPAEEYHRDYSKRNKAAYDEYRQGCGRDQVLRQVWKQD